MNSGNEIKTKITFSSIHDVFSCPGKIRMCPGMSWKCPGILSWWRCMNHNSWFGGNVKQKYGSCDRHERITATVDTNFCLRLP